MHKVFLLTMAVVAGSLVPAPPACAADLDAVSIDVAVHDLDLGTAAGLARLDARLARAATQACEAPSRKGAFNNQTFSACKTAALGAARTQAARIAEAQAKGGGTLLAARR